MDRAGRLRKTRDFETVRREGNSWSDRRLVLVARPTGAPRTRIGFAVSSRLGNAVVRNKIKRRLKSAAAELAPKSGWDLVVIARIGSKATGFQDLKRSLSRLIVRGRLNENQQ